MAPFSTRRQPRNDNPRIRELARIAVAVVIVAAAIVATRSPAAADVGVAIEPGELTVNDSVAAGGQITLPAMRVHNPGDVDTTYRLRATGLEGTSANPADGGWFSVEPAEVRLAAGESADVVPLIAPDGEADAGRYAAIVRAEIVPEGGGTRIGAAAGVRVFFDVSTDASSGGFATAWILAAAAFVLVLLILARKAGLKVRFEHRAT